MLQKYRHYQLVKLINTSTSRKTNKKKVDTLKCLNISNKTNEFKQIESIFPKNQLNKLIINKTK